MASWTASRSTAQTRGTVALFNSFTSSAFLSQLVSLQRASRVSGGLGHRPTYPVLQSVVNIFKKDVWVGGMMDGNCSVS